MLDRGTAIWCAVGGRIVPAAMGRGYGSRRGAETAEAERGEGHSLREGAGPKADIYALPLSLSLSLSLFSAPPAPPREPIFPSIPASPASEQSKNIPLSYTPPPG